MSPSWDFGDVLIIFGFAVICVFPVSSLLQFLYGLTKETLSKFVNVYLAGSTFTMAIFASTAALLIFVDFGQATVARDFVAGMAIAQLLVAMTLAFGTCKETYQEEKERLPTYVEAVKETHEELPSFEQALHM